ncbi:hypothetical protein CHUAL_000120 [Chamberlinius hualienensis]
MESNGQQQQDNDSNGNSSSESSSQGQNDDESSKRQRILSGNGNANANGGSPSPAIFFQGIAASPPRFVSLEQIMKAANAVSKMTLAHEIALNKDFKLEKIEPEDTLEKQVKAVVHQAFWDILRTQLYGDPPSFDHAMILLAEIKDDLLSLLLPHHYKQKQEIGEVLDVELIRQKAENNALDFHYYAQYILSVMAKLCAPVRDEKIRELVTCQDVIDTFKGIFETLDLMKLDMANFHIQAIRPHLQQQSVEYEKKRFEEYMKLSGELNDCEDSLMLTRQWLKRCCNLLPKPTTVSAVLTKAFMSLLSWEKDQPFPETLFMDKTRLAELCVRLDKATLIAAIMLVTYNTVGSAIAGLSQFKEELKNHLNVLLDKFDDKKLNEVIQDVAVQVLVDVNRSLTDHGFSQLSEEAGKSLKGQIEETIQPDHRVRNLVRTRILEFTEQCLSSSSAYPVKIPPGLSIMQLELSELTGQFLRLVSHNRAVFTSSYVDILSPELLQEQEQTTESTDQESVTSTAV